MKPNNVSSMASRAVPSLVADSPPPTYKKPKEESDALFASKATKIMGKCDICQQQDGSHGRNLQKCKECNLLVHERCYGMVPAGYNNPDFVCHGCKAVGSKVEVNVPSRVGGCGDKMGKRRGSVEQEQRPTECVLCSHDKGVHAMHPLLDTHGTDGRQLVLHGCGDGAKRKEKRLAWVHTLCASVICSNPKTAGCVYGCFRDGSYEGISKEDESKLESSGEEDGITCENQFKERDLCSFAIASKDNGLKTPWTRAIERNCEELICFICGQKNKNYRIPVQCVAGEENELKRFKKLHLNLNDNAGTECSVAMHVGCARWGFRQETEGAHLEKINGRPCRLCYFLPGDEGEGKLDMHGDSAGRVVAHCYCTAHAREIIVNNPRFTKSVRATDSIPPVGARAIRQNDLGRRLVSPHRKSPNESNQGMHAGFRMKSEERDTVSFKKGANSYPEVTKSFTATGSSPRVGSVRSTSQNDLGRIPPCRKSPNQPNQGMRVGSRMESAKRARASSKKSMNSFRKRGGTNQSIPRKRKFAVEPIFGSCSRKKEDSAEENRARFRVRGKSANALAKSSIQSSGRVHPSAVSSNESIRISGQNSLSVVSSYNLPGKSPRKTNHSLLPNHLQVA
mmetsp:Transcript_15729/g.34046  ORF Transcript_15729/g.34046 Transcript_15729/m.34046 type:complete len:622 (-) Transcript_15729:131-1996(-)